ncbi:MAG: hypothetical protein ABR613_00690 [Actinomycetota bacterium]
MFLYGHGMAREQRGPAREGVSAREVVAAAAAAVFLALVTTWPLPARLGSHVPEVGFGDPYIQAWQVAWGGHALATPADLFEANVFWPEQDSFAFSDALIGYAPAGILGSGSTAALVRYNLLFLCAYALPFFAAFLLARELGASPVAAAVAGAAFAYAPFRSDQATHLHVISSGAIPLALFALVRGYGRSRPGWVLAGWLVATWQVAIGFSLGLQLAYLLLVTGVCVLAPAATRGWRNYDRRLVVPTVAGVAVLLVYSTWQAIPYLRVAREHPAAARTEREVDLYSPPAAAFLAAPDGNRLWGGATDAARDALRRPTEQSLFPGAVTTVLAIAGAAAGSLRRRLRWALAAGTLVTALLALGTSPWFGDYLYGALYELAPGWQGVRTPGRLVTLTSLGLALLAAFGAEVAVRAVRADRRGGWVAAGLALAVVVEGAGRISVTPAPAVPAAAVEAPAPQLHLPSDEQTDRVYTYFSTDGFPEMVNGLGAFTPRTLDEVRANTAGFPDAASIGYLASLGVSSVVFHPALAEKTPWADVATTPVEGLPVTREDHGAVIVFRLVP